MNTLNKTKSNSKKTFLKFTIVILAIIATVLLNSFGLYAQKPFTVVVNPGHGGKDSGNMNKNILEKDITLNVALKLKEMANDKTIHLILIRNTDKDISLNKRIEFSNKQHADLFIDLHCSESPNNGNRGFEVYFSTEQNKVNKTSSIIAATTITTKLLDLPFIHSVKLKDENFHLIKNIKYPSIVINLGYLSNDEDRGIITNEQDVEKIARSIYSGIKAIQEKQTNSK